MDIVFLIYGLAFLALGLVIVLRLEHESRLELINILWLLGAFAFVHGFLEWIDLWRTVRHATDVVDATRSTVLLVSYLFLFEFGRRLVRVATAAQANANSVRGLLGAWLYAPLLGGISAAMMLSGQPLLALAVWSRYLFGFPASFLAGVGFHVYWLYCIKPNTPISEVRTIRIASQVASAAFIAYAIFGGLIVRRADWFPASVVNQDTFVAAFGVPVQLARTICAVLMTVSVGVLLRIFHIESLQQLRDALRTTERALEDLRKRESLLSNSPVVLYTGAPTPPFGATFVSQNVRQITGYMPEQFTEDREFWLKNIHPEDRLRILGSLPALTECGSHQYEYRFRVSDGSYRWMNGEMRLLRETASSDAILVGYWADATERKRAEEKLSQQKVLLSTILASASEAIFAKDVDGKYLFMNEVGAQMLGYKAIDVIGRTDADLLPAHLAIAFRKADERVMSTGETDVNEPVGLVKNKRRAYIAHKKAWRNQSGEIIGVIGVSTDITERMAVEDALRKTVAFSEALSEAMPLPVFHKDVSGRYTGCNSAFARFIGKTKGEITGKTVFELSPQSFAKTYRDKDLDLLDDPTGTQTYESKVASADGRVRDVIFHKARLTDGIGTPTGIVGVITDISELKQIHAKQAQLESQLRESQKMEALGTLAGGIAHDFNNIVAAILGNAELARQDAGANLVAMESLEEIRKAGTRARDLVRQILAFSRREPTKRRPIMLEQVVEESVHMLRATLPARVTLEFHCEPRVPAVLADATQSQQVLVNLATNAMQAMRGEPGCIVISLNMVMLDVQLANRHPALAALHEKYPGRTVRLMVSDNGPGMDASTLERVFEPFFTTKAVDEGTGLGLSVVHGIVQAHEGAIVVESAPGKGATFTIYLPVAKLEHALAGTSESNRGEGAVATGSASAPALSLDGNQHILYLDDDESLVFLVKRLLERRGYHVSGHTEQGEALAALRAHPAAFDLVVSDYNMPGMSGLDVAREIREIRADLPVAIASGFIDEELRAKAGGAGVRELIFKADVVEEFCAVVQRLAQAVVAPAKDT